MHRQGHSSGRYPARRAAGVMVASLALAAGAACGGGDTGSAAADSPLATPETPAAGAPAPGAPAAPAGPFTESGITPQMVALGDSIFKGQAAGGICFTCHGQNAEGSAIGPSLTDQEWLNGDGSLEFIATTVRNGVAQPKQFPAPMPGFGTTFTEDQVRAVSAYVYSRTHPNVGGGA